MRYRTVDCCPMAATQKMSCAPLSPLAASSAGSFNNSPVNSGILPTDSPEEPIKDAPNTTRKKFLYNLSRASYQKNWGNEYQRPGRRSSVLTFLVRIMPRVGKSRDLRFRMPTAAAEK